MLLPVVADTPDVLLTVLPRWDTFHVLKGHAAALALQAEVLFMPEHRCLLHEPASHVPGGLSRVILHNSKLICLLLPGTEP